MDERKVSEKRPLRVPEQASHEAGTFTLRSGLTFLLHFHSRIPTIRPMVKITGEYQGNLHCRAVHGPSGGVLFTSAPVDVGGAGDAFSPTDLMATALATCIATTLANSVRKRGVELRGLRWEITKQMSTDTPRRIARLGLTLAMPLKQTPELAAELDQVIKGCPVHQSLHPSVAVAVAITWAK
jgi:putative redox protein